MGDIVDALRAYSGLSYSEITQFSGRSCNTGKNGGDLDALLAQQRIHIARR